MPANTTELEKRLWGAADELRANSKLKSSEYSVPVLGLIFLRYADHKFGKAKEKFASQGGGRRTIGKADYQAKGILYLPETARFSYLLNLPESSDIGKAINDAMRALEADNEDLKDVLPRTYNRLDKELIFSLLKSFAKVPMDIEGDAFGKIYEYFLGRFAMTEGQKGGEFFTPTSIVKLIVEIIEPYHGRIYDPACGSGGMFVQSAAFVEHHKKLVTDISIYGQEKVAETIRLCKMNLAVHGLSGDIKQGVTYYEDIHKSLGKFDFVMANPPFNVDKVDKEKLKDDPRYPFALPKADNANYLWIQIFYSTLNEKGRAGFVMANSAGDARGSELEIRKMMLEDRAVDVMISVGPNFFYTVTLPCTLWFLDRGKKKTEALQSEHPAKHDAVTVLKELQKLEAIVEYLTDKIGKAPTKAESKAKELRNGPPATKAARELVGRILTRMTDRVKGQYENDLEDGWAELLEDFFARKHPSQLKFLEIDKRSIEALRKRNEAAKAKHKEATGYEFGFKAERRPVRNVESLLDETCVIRDKGGEVFRMSQLGFVRSDGTPTYADLNPVWTPHRDWKERIRRKAMEAGDNMQAQFVAKNTGKLAAIVEAKANLHGEPKIVNVRYNKGTIEGNVKFSFKDGSHFTVRNKIVSKRSYHSGGFHQHPTTFHDAVLPNGEGIPGQPSEQQMKSVFVKKRSIRH